MSVGPRQSVDELVTEYLLHADVKHIYVEGPKDHTVVNWYLSELTGGPLEEIYAIDSVEVTIELLERHGVKGGGNRGRLLALAKELDSALPDGSEPALCIVDADFDYLLGRQESGRFLAVTDGTSLETYAFSEGALGRVLRLGSGSGGPTPTELMDNLHKVLRELFIIRAANEKLQYGLSWIPFVKRCRVLTNGGIAFDVDRFTRDYVANNSASDRLAEFRACIRELQDRDLPVYEQGIRGEDFAILLARYLRETGSTHVDKSVLKVDVVSAMLFVGLDFEELAETPLFQRLKEFVDGES